MVQNCTSLLVGHTYDAQSTNSLFSAELTTKKDLLCSLQFNDIFQEIPKNRKNHSNATLLVTHLNISIVMFLDCSDMIFIIYVFIFYNILRQKSK